MQFVAVVLAAFMCTSCCTQALWENTDPNERIWIPENQITEEELQQRGIEYKRYESSLGGGFFVEKSTVTKLGDYTFRALGTPVTVVVDTLGAVSVIGSLILITALTEDPTILMMFIN